MIDIGFIKIVSNVNPTPRIIRQFNNPDSVILKKLYPIKTRQVKIPITPTSNNTISTTPVGY
jgi:hypothetical protein